LPGSPKRELREYASSHLKPGRIPSARASGFTGTGHGIPTPPWPSPPAVPFQQRRALASDMPSLLGSPKRELREYASSHLKPGRIPSARASGFTGTGHGIPTPPWPSPPAVPFQQRRALASDMPSLLGSPKRELREYASSRLKPGRIPSAHASGFTGTGHGIPTPPWPSPHRHAAPAARMAAHREPAEAGQARRGRMPRPRVKLPRHRPAARMAAYREPAEAGQARRGRMPRPRVFTDS
jgi:hypothetical protein